MQEKELKRLLKRYKEGKATAAEKAFLESWYLRYEASTHEEYTSDAIAEDAAAVWKKLHKTVKAPAPVLTVRRIAAAALIVLTLCAGLFYYYSRSKDTEKVAQADIGPGSNKAFLTLGDGTRMSLTDVSKDKLVGRAGIAAINTRDGQLTYAKTLPNVSAGITERTYNVVETPAGGQWQVTLPDGTRVWLNAASSLRYPVSFQGHERRVELTGEAYFEVVSLPLPPSPKGGQPRSPKGRQSKIPFIVQINSPSGERAAVEVLGTHFNVNAYADEPRITTTLLEGAVRVSAGDSQQFLKPGEQSSTTGNEIVVNAVDTEGAVAWKNGYFLFESEDILSIMRKISRWYDVEVVYAEGKVPVHHFWGSISRFQHVSQVLKKLELTNQVHFKIEGRRIIVMQ